MDIKCTSIKEILHFEDNQTIENICLTNICGCSTGSMIPSSRGNYLLLYYANNTSKEPYCHRQCVKKEDAERVYNKVCKGLGL